FNWGKWLAESEPRRRLVEHQGIAPCIPAWKAGVYLSTPMLDGKGLPSRSPQANESPPTHFVLRRDSLRPLHVQRAKAGIPCGSCTPLNGFADRCLGCSANGMQSDLDNKSRVEACMRFGRITTRIGNYSSLPDNEICMAMNMTVNPQSRPALSHEGLQV